MRPFLFVGILLPFTLTAQEAKPDAAVIELRATISKIVDTETLRSEEESDWAARKAEMANLLELQQRELALLSEELEKAGSSSHGYDERKREAEAELEGLKQARRLVKEAVGSHKPRLLSLVRLLPAPLLDEMANEKATLEAWTPDSEARDGLQSMLGIISKAEQFNRRFTRANELRDGREVEVLYLGLAAAYYADHNGHAGMGTPGADGWEWTRKPDLADEIRQAFDQLDRKRPPEVVNLPVQIKEVQP